MTSKKLLKRLLIGAVLATLPLALCLVVAELMIVFGVEPDGVPDELAVARRGYAGFVAVFGVALSLVSWCGLLLYSWCKIWTLTMSNQNRHERKLKKMRERGEIDF